MTDSTSNANGARIFYARVDEFARKEEKYRFLDDARSAAGVQWQELEPDAKNNWLTEGLHDEFETFIAIGSKEAKASDNLDTATIFKNYGRGVATTRDAWAYNFDKNSLVSNIKRTIETYNEQVFKWIHRKDDKVKLDDFVLNDDTQISWSEGLKNFLSRCILIEYDESHIRRSLYRPFTMSFLYFDARLNERRYQFPSIFPSPRTEEENKVICFNGVGSEKPFTPIISNTIVNLSFLGGGSAFQSFPFYTYNEDGTNRRENITDWALSQFRAQYEDEAITKLDIFHYVYALLHHPTYRTTYAANLKRELPRIPFVKSSADFRAFNSAGTRLADLHVNYESQSEYPLERVENPQAELSWLVRRMHLSKDKRSIIYNDFLTLEGVPQEAFEYRLGNRSALEWIIDQYQVSTDRRSGITNDPNRADEPDYIVRLIGKVITVSLETVKIVHALPDLQLS